MEEDILAFPILVDLECPPVLTYIVMPFCRERRVVLEMASPCITHVEIYRISITVEFPHSRNRHCIPSACIIIGLVEIHRTGIHVLVPIEIPDSIKHKLETVCLKGCRHRSTVFLNHIRILPCRQCSLLGRCRSNSSHTQRKGAENSCHLSFHNVSVLC